MLTKKFINKKQVDDFEVLTDNGWEDIKGIGKTIPFVVFEIKTTNHHLRCADTHLVFDDEYNEIFVKDLKCGDEILTETGPERIEEIIITDKQENMYDLELNDGNRRFYTNGILSHNSVFLCHSTSSLIRSGKNVLYISGELSVKEVNKRLDANMLKIGINKLNQNIDVDNFKLKTRKVFEQPHGELVVKYASAGSMNALHIKALIQEVKLKKNFVPDVIVLDHLTLFSSSRLPANQTGSHLYVRCVVEEIRAIAVEHDCCILTACQLNRNAKSRKNDVSNEDVALGYAISETSDLSIALIQSSELKEQNKFLCKVMKTRFGSNTEDIYTVGIDYETMTLVNLDEAEQVLPVHIQDQQKAFTRKKDAAEEKTLFAGFVFDQEN